MRPGLNEAQIQAAEAANRRDDERQQRADAERDQLTADLATAIAGRDAAIADLEAVNLRNMNDSADLSTARAEVEALTKERDAWHREASQHLADTVKLTTGFNEEIDTLRAELQSAKEAIDRQANYEDVVSNLSYALSELKKSVAEYDNAIACAPGRARDVAVDYKGIGVIVAASNGVKALAGQDSK